MVEIEKAMTTMIKRDNINNRLIHKITTKTVIIRINLHKHSNKIEHNSNNKVMLKDKIKDKQIQLHKIDQEMDMFHLVVKE